MKTTDECLNEIMKRSEDIRYRHNTKKKIVIEAVLSGAVLCLMGFVIAVMPKVQAAPESASFVQYGSLILRTSYMGYAIVGTLAFIFGILFTMICLRVRDLKKKE